MPESADNTGYIANLLTNTNSGLIWLMDYFHSTRLNIADGNWDNAKARQQFRDVTMMSKPQSSMGTEILEDTIDWESLYDRCWDITEPKDDWLRQELRSRLERRGINPDEFGWDLSLTGEDAVERTKREIRERLEKQGIDPDDFPTFIKK